MLLKLNDFDNNAKIFAGFLLSVSNTCFYFVELFFCAFSNFVVVLIKTGGSKTAKMSMKHEPLRYAHDQGHTDICFSENGR